MKGNEEQFAELIQRYEKSLYKFIVSKVKHTKIEYMAEDICQESFYKAYRHLNHFREEEACMSTWLFTIARNTVIDELRKSKDAMYLEDSPQELAAGCKELPEALLLQYERASMVKQAIGRLPNNQRKAVMLREYEEKNYEEIAKMLNVTVCSVKSLLFRARHRIKFMLTPFMQDIS